MQFEHPPIYYNLNQTPNEQELYNLGKKAQISTEHLRNEILVKPENAPRCHIYKIRHCLVNIGVNDPSLSLRSKRGSKAGKVEVNKYYLYIEGWSNNDILNVILYGHDF